MMHFISGLPRSGSTLLGAILRQNPDFHASMSSPVAELVLAMLGGTSEASDFFTDDDTRLRLVRAVFDAYYSNLAKKRLVFDTNRKWCTMMTGLGALFPQCRVVCCVRDPAWILDSIERQVRKNPFRPQRMFQMELNSTVYMRAEALMRPNGVIGMPWGSLRQAWFSEEATRLIVVRYEGLIASPRETINQLYSCLEEAYFEHNFENLEFDKGDYDQWLGMPGLHRVRSRIEVAARESILPTDLFEQYKGGFWDSPDQNLRKVIVLPDDR